MSLLTARCLGSALLSMAIGLSGCASPMWAGSQAKAEHGPPPPQCAVELKPSGGASKVAQVEVSESSTVQQVLEKSGAHRKYSRVKVDLCRKLPNGAWHKMEVQYDVTHK